MPSRSAPSTMVSPEVDVETLRSVCVLVRRVRSLLLTLKTIDPLKNPSVVPRNPSPVSMARSMSSKETALSSTPDPNAITHPRVRSGSGRHTAIRAPMRSVDWPTRPHANASPIEDHVAGDHHGGECRAVLAYSDQTSRVCGTLVRRPSSLTSSTVRIRDETGHMLTSESRILTTHSGSLPRPRSLADLHGRRSRGEQVDERELRAAVEEATAAVVAAQVEAGIDIGNDGEQARESFFTYVQHRMTGFGGDQQARR